MKIPTHILTGVALLAAALSTSYGQTATTDPVGYRTENLKPGFNLIGVDLAEKVEAAGVLTGVAGNDVSDSAVDFTSLAGKDLLFKLTDGANAGSLFQADQKDAHTLTLVAAGGLPAVGNKYEVRVTSTVSTIFGATNSAGLQTGTDETTADAVYIPNGSGGFVVVFYASAADAANLGLPGAGWYDSNFTAAGDTAIPYSLGVFVRRNAAAAKDVVFVGHVVTNPTKVTVKSGYNFISRILPVPMTTTQSNLQASLASGTDETTADAIYNPTSPGVYEVYFYASAADAANLGLPGAGWYNSNFEDANAKALNSGFLIRRNQAATITSTIPIPAGLDI